MQPQDCISINRISSKSQDEGYSLGQQAKLNREIATRDGRRIVKEFNIVESAKTNEKRDEFNEVIEYLKKHSNIKFAYIEKPDRLTRNLKDIVLTYEMVNNFDKTFVFSRDSFILSKDSNSHAKFQFDIKAILAKNYIDNLSDEVRKGQKGMLEEGKWPSGTTPIGYKRIDKAIVPHEIESKFVVKAFELYVSGKHSLKTLKQVLDEQGFRDKKGNPFTRSTFHRILINPFYYGTMLWNGKTYKGSFEPLIEEGLFHRTQAMLRRTNNGDAIPAYVKHNFTYQRLVRCGDCGCAISGEKHRKTNKGNGKVHEWIYYHCSHFNPCNQKGCIREEKIDNQIVSSLLNIELDKQSTEMLKQKLRESHAEQVLYREQALIQINGELVRVRLNLDEIYEDKLKSIIDEEMFLRKRVELLKKQDNLLELINRHKIADKKYVDFGCLVLDVANLASKIYGVRNMEEKRHLLNFVFSNLLLKNNVLENRLKNIMVMVAGYVETKNVLGVRDSNPNKQVQNLLSYH